ncbi:tetratricopeptide repeat domain protein [Renibacterium salmoninarum ATCC 33209]|uniref:Tetratricopeptide repeat domain protein n=1 Tax=Renibacterium salmoninarum (strain ATCC 33209 / DSM 20767 / JCM 11484 / NBRC 15589 / NCIMB 2235) TaxID=288705 RepID=A9WVE3_RENSM|nr:tetratricopeptide repeat domain protein [Renibacterium salmoninarum ATCC 33209]
MSNSYAPPIPPAVEAGALPGPDEGQEGDARLARRRKLIFWLLPFAIIALLVAAKLFSVQIASVQANSAFLKNDAAGVHAAAGVLKVVNVIEPYKAWFNDGDGYVLSGDFASARTQFEQALSLASADESCKVRVNLVLTLEKLGDAKQASADPTAAKALYDGGVKIAADAPQGCFQKGSNGKQQGEGEKLQDSKGRLEEKSKGSQAQGQPNQTPGDQSPSPSSDSSKLDQLNKQNQGAQQDRNDGQQIGGDAGNLPPFDPNGKQW